MHGGRMILRGDVSGIHFPHQTTSHTASAEEMAAMEPYLTRFCALFGYDADTLQHDTYTVVVPDSRNPYRQMYVAN